ncbi:MAG: arsenite efflux transporter metallochaperone ArsD [Nitriliruptoraceae bacterium]
MATVEVFDPAMCCSTGVCGPTVDPALTRFASDLDWLADQGANVRRFNLGQEPGAFEDNETVRALLHSEGESSLPVVLVDGEKRSSGRYPSRDELVELTGLTPAVRELTTELITELAAVGAAVGSNCEPCLKYHYNEARQLGVTKAELVLAVRAAQVVKDTPAGKVLDLAGKLLGVDRTELGGRVPDGTDAEGACCEPHGASLPLVEQASSGGKCC